MGATLNISKEVIQAAGYPGRVNKVTGQFEPFYTRPDGQGNEQKLYTDPDWTKYAKMIYNQPNNVRGVIITANGIYVRFHEKFKGFNPKTKKFELVSDYTRYYNNKTQMIMSIAKKNRQQGLQSENLFNQAKMVDWIDTPRMMSNIEYIIVSEIIIQNSQLMYQARNKLIQTIQKARAQDSKQFGRFIGMVLLKNADDIDINRFKSMSDSEIDGLFDKGTVVYKTNVDRNNKPTTYVTRTEYYKYDLEVLQVKNAKAVKDKQLSSQASGQSQIAEKLIKRDPNKKSSIEVEFEKIRQELGDDTAAVIARTAIGDIFLLGKEARSQEDKIKQQIIDDMSDNGQKVFSKYVKH